MSIKMILFQGDSSDIVETTVYSAGAQVTNLISSGYSANISLVSSIGSSPDISKVMSEVDNKFRGVFLPSETASIAAGLYKCVVQVKNDGVNYKKEEHFDVRVNAQGYQE